MNKLIKTAVAIAFGVAVSGCANSGTSTGNPVVRLEFNAYNSAAAISSIKFCFKRLRFKQFGETTTADPALDSDNVDFELGEVTVSELGTLLGSISLPQGTYSRIEFDLENSCASGKSIQLTNSNGSFSTNQRVTIKFEGTFNHSVSGPLGLSVQPITSALNTVTLDTQIKTKAESVSGAY